MQVELCRHIKSDGTQCRAVALRDHHFCYFHRSLNEGHRLYRSTMVGKRRLMDRGFIIPLPPLEDRVSVQLALSEVINALACNFIDSKRANALFFGLKLAAANARGLEMVSQPTAVVRDYSPAPDILESVAVDLAPSGRTCEIEDPPAPTVPDFVFPPRVEIPTNLDNSALEERLEAEFAAICRQGELEEQAAALKEQPTPPQEQPTPQPAPPQEQPTPKRVTTQPNTAPQTPPLNSPEGSSLGWLPQNYGPPFAAVASR